MNKIIATLVFIISTQLSLGQSVLDKYDDQAGISSIIVTNKMFELMSKINNNTTDAELQKYNKLLKKLDNLKVFMTLNSKITANMKATAAQYLKTANLEELMRMTNDEGKNIKMFVKESSTNPDFIKEIFMFIEGGTKEN